MKAKILIITSLVVALTLAYCSQSHAQIPRDKCPSIVNSSDTILLADETTLTWGKTDAKIHCSNESVFNDLYKSHGILFKRYTCTWKKDRHGNYRDYLIYVNRQDAQLIINWSKHNL